MKQTTREQLQIIIDAIDAGESGVLVKIEPNSKAGVRSYHDTLLLTAQVTCEVTRIPKPPETISGAYADGTKWEINAPMRGAPAKGVKYFYARPDGDTGSTEWDGALFDTQTLADCNCWATKADAKAWADVSRRLRSGV